MTATQLVVRGLISPYPLLQGSHSYGDTQICTIKMADANLSGPAKADGDRVWIRQTLPGSVPPPSLGWCAHWPALFLTSICPHPPKHLGSHFLSTPTWHRAWILPPWANTHPYTGWAEEVQACLMIKCSGLQSASPFPLASGVLLGLKLKWGPPYSNKLTVYTPWLWANSYNQVGSEWQ